MASVEDTEKRRDLLKCSYLTKAPPGIDNFTFRQWRRRWFVLLDSAIVYPMAPRSVRLEYYESEEAANTMGDAKGIIDLRECSAVRKSDRAVKGHKYVFIVITDHREYYLSADSAADRNSWVEILHAVISDDFKAREYREYLRQSKVYNQDPGPAMAAVATVGVTSAATDSMATYDEPLATARERPASSVAVQRQLRNTKSMQELTTSSDINSSSSQKKGTVYTEVGPRPPHPNSSQFQRKSGSSPSLRLHSTTVETDYEPPPPVPIKNEALRREEEHTRAGKLAQRDRGFSADGSERVLTFERNGVEIPALTPLRFGAWDDDDGDLADMSPNAGLYQNLPKSVSLDSTDLKQASRSTSAAYNHVVHPPSVKHKDRVKPLAKHGGLDSDLQFNDYSEVADMGDDDTDGAGYKSVRRHSALPGTVARGHGYEEIMLQSPSKSIEPPRSPGRSAQLKRVSSLDIKKRMGVSPPIDAAPRHQPAAAGAGADHGGRRDIRGSGSYDQLSSPKVQKRMQSPPGKPVVAPKPHRGLVPKQDSYDHLTPPPSPGADRRSAPNLDFTRTPPPQLSLGPRSPSPQRLSPHVPPRRRVSSPNVLDEGDHARLMALQPPSLSHSGASSPRLPPRNIHQGKSEGTGSLEAPRPSMRKSKSVQAMGRDLGLEGLLGQQNHQLQKTGPRGSVPDLYVGDGYPQEDIYDQAA